MSYQPTNIESRRIMTETIKTLLQPIQERLDDALMHQTLDPADYADMAWKTTPDTARLLAAVQAVAALHFMEFIEDGEHSRTRCEECLYEQEDNEECPTMAAVVAALGGEA